MNTMAKYLVLLLLGAFSAYGQPSPNTLKAKAPEVYKVKFTTTKGDVTIQVNRAWAPIGADRFYNLVKGGVYKDAAFFRIVPRFVAQFGIPALPKVSGAWDRAFLLDDVVKQSNKRGTLTFGSAGPNTRTTQIFINLSDNTSLDSQAFAPFGEVIDGMDVVDGFYAEYGEAPDQRLITAQGNAYLDKNFPKLDRILTAVVMETQIEAQRQPPSNLGATDDKRTFPMLREGGVYVVPVVINNAITLNFVVDSGAADVSIPADVVTTLMRTGTITKSDFIDAKTYTLADGSTTSSPTFRIRSLKLGDIILHDVMGSVANVKGDLLLGQSFLGRFKSWSIDNAKHALILELTNVGGMHRQS
jgi:peptidyl-prolyl cis-trans isomerase A (cyclophilin A)